MRTLQEVSETIRMQAGAISEGAKERSYQMIEDWLQIFPKLQSYGLALNSFSVSIAISPGLEAELLGHHPDFSPERLDEILRECKGSTALTSVFTTIKTTYSLHRRTKLPAIEPLIVKISVRITPEIAVYIGKPLIE